ncbi:hypothetical protein AMTRI_Chr08g164180 [Amborella trichopoda]
MGTLRSFPEGLVKNCYTFGHVTQGSKNLLRASFYYGNYDRRNAPPTFDLLLDADKWATVDTADSPVFFELVYTAKRDGISVCLAQTSKDQIPFINTLEIRGLDSGMYSHISSEASDDPYDRIWTPFNVSNGLSTVTSEATLITTSVPDEPPPAVMQTTATSGSATTPIDLTLKLSASYAYLTMYFTEPIELEATRNRSFNIYGDGKLLYGPVIPPYASTVEITAPNTSVSATTKISFVPTAQSTLPPVISAMEVYLIGGPLKKGTNENDLKGLKALQNEFEQLQAWGGDPCLPANFIWERVDFELSGSLPDFSSMNELQIINLKNNSLNGNVPDFLADFPKLNELNLADNGFLGVVSESLVKNTHLKLDVSGNPNLCDFGESCDGSINGSKKKKNRTGVIVGDTVPSFLFLWAVAGVVFFVNHRRKAAAFAVIHAHQIQDDDLIWTESSDSSNTSDTDSSMSIQENDCSYPIPTHNVHTLTQEDNFILDIIDKISDPNEKRPVITQFISLTKNKAKPLPINKSEEYNFASIMKRGGNTDSNDEQPLSLALQLFEENKNSNILLLPSPTNMGAQALLAETNNP